MADKRTPQEQVTDGYNKAAYGIPYDRELKAMNDKTLSVEIQQSAPGSARHSVLVLEMEKRKSSLTGTKSGWIHRNGRDLLIGILASLLATALWLYYGLG